MSNPSTAPQQSSTSFWTDQERRFPDGGNQPTQSLALAPVAQKSQSLSLPSHSLSRESKVHAACLDHKGSEKNDLEEDATLSSENNTSGNEEKLPLLNKTVELRKLNKELMKLNQEWEQIYHTATLQMQQKMSSLQMQVVSLKQRAECLTVKLDYEQNKKEYYEQALLQEIRKNQRLQEYVRHLENKLHQNPDKRPLGNFLESYGTSPNLLTRKSLKDSAQMRYKLGNAKGPKPECCQHWLEIPNMDKEVTDLIDQLETLNHQMEALEMDTLTESKERHRMKTESDNFYKKEEEMRQQMVRLQEQIKILEEDFRKERFDKTAFPRLLSKVRSISPIPKAIEGHPREKLSAFSITSMSRPRPGGCSKQ